MRSSSPEYAVGIRGTLLSGLSYAGGSVVLFRHKTWGRMIMINSGKHSLAHESNNTAYIPSFGVGSVEPMASL